MRSPQGNRARKDTGQWLSVKPSLLNGTDLSGQEYTDMNLRYGGSWSLQSHCDGCGQTFSVQHAFECKVACDLTSQ
jgi:hypothetical protein